LLTLGQRRKKARKDVKLEYGMSLATVRTSKPLGSVL